MTTPKAGSPTSRRLRKWTSSTSSAAWATSAHERACQVLRSTAPRAQNSRMETRTTAPVESPLPLRPQDEIECRHCEVHCDKVVYPAACLERACPFVYAYEEFGHTYMGCMQKVF